MFAIKAEEGIGATFSFFVENSGGSGFTSDSLGTSECKGVIVGSGSKLVVSKFLVGMLAFCGITLGLAVPAHATSCLPTPPAPNYVVPAGSIQNNDVFTICDYRGWNFTLQSASNVDFSISYLAGANFQGSSFPGVIFGNNSSHSINFTNANLQGAQISSDMSSSIFDGANISGSNLHFAHLDGASMVGTNLTNANLVNTFFPGARLVSADLTGANLTEAYLQGANLGGATVTRSQLAVAYLDEYTICPDNFPLGMHQGDCWGPFIAPTAVTTAPVIGSSGFTFDITNAYPDFYTFTVAVTAGPGVASTSIPNGKIQPVVVTGAPPGSPTVVTITSTTVDPTTGPAVSTTTYNYQEEVAKELARTGPATGVVATELVMSGALIFMGIGVYLYSRRRFIRN